MQTFDGFPAGTSGTVQVPNLFFSELLPIIDDLAELKVTTYCFWALQQREGKYRYVRLRDMLDDPRLLAGFAPDVTAARTVMQHALDQAVRRGTLLAQQLTSAQADETLYFMNTERGRAAVEALARGDWTPGTFDNPVALVTERPNIFAIYEQNIGALTPLISDVLRDAEQTYPASWIEEAVQIAVENNKRNWRYIEAILKRWLAEGKTARPAKTERAENPYLQHEYFQDDPSNG